MTDRDIIHNLEEKIKHQRLEIKRLLDSGNILLSEKEKFRLENTNLKNYVNKYMNLSNCAVDLLLCEDDRRELKKELDSITTRYNNFRVEINNLMIRFVMLKHVDIFNMYEVIIKKFCM